MSFFSKDILSVSSILYGQRLIKNPNNASDWIGADFKQLPDPFKNLKTLTIGLKYIGSPRLCQGQQWWVPLLMSGGVDT
jgi:hypothetical protein